jgi:ribosomal protein S18 acetylase RimI-like enzyme
MSDLIVRQMKRSDFDLVIGWAASEGWNPGSFDADSFFKADENGYFVGELDGEIVASISAIAYSESYAFIGFYIVKPQFRGSGYGMKVWEAAIAYLGTERNIGLDGVATQQKNYEKSGFRIAYNHIRYEAVGGGVAPDEILELKAVLFEEIVAYDRELFPAQRKEFLRLWISQRNSAAFGIIREGLLAGFGVIRQSHTGYRIGPLNANDDKIAEQLLLALLAFAQSGPVFLDVPDINLAAMELVQRCGMKPIFETARMYTKEISTLPINRVFAVTSLELG